MRRTSYLALFLGLAACLWQGCEPTTKPADNKGQAAHVPAIPVPDFNADSAYAFVAKQCSFGPRVPNTKAHQQCGDWLAAEFRRLGATVIEQKADLKNHKGETLKARNIIASLNPEATKRILLSAHWDSRPVADADSQRTSQPIIGANDGASGVGVLLEMCRVLKQNPPKVGVDFILWDAEDGGISGSNESWCLGSQYWAKNPHKPNYQAAYAVNLDMVGAGKATFPMEGNSVIFAKNIVENIWNTAHQMGYGGYFPMAKVGDILDDHVFVARIAGIPAVDIIHLSLENEGDTFFPHWHTHGDTMDKIDPATLKAVGHTMLAVVVREQ